MNKRTVCFFMLYHGRPELTRMSMYHMAKTIKKFNAADHNSVGVVIGDYGPEAEYAGNLGLEHFYHPNDPLYKKFSFAWIQSLLKETEYICWFGSNNLHSEEYWDKCISTLEGKKEVTFGSNKFSVVNSSKDTQETCTFKTRDSAHLCSAGQFYLTYSLDQAVNFRSIFKPGQSFNFDGVINKAFTNKWGRSTVKTISSEPSDCLDIKNEENIHSYNSYMRKRGGVYPIYKNRDDLLEDFKELKMLDNDQFKAI